MRGLISKWIALAVITLAPAIAISQVYPSHPIKWIVPVPAGTSPDITARILAEKMSPVIGQQIVVLNIPGAGGNIGSATAARAPGDGYTWFFATSPMAVNMKFFKSPGYDAIKDFKHIAPIAEYDNVIVVNKNSPYQSIEDLISAIKKEPGKHNYSSGGVGTPTHVVPAMILKSVSGDAVHVAFKGGSESINALVAGQVDFAAPVTQIGMNQVKAGRARALAVSASRRNAIAPEVPTLKERNIPVTLSSFSGLSVPASTPPEIVSKIEKALKTVLARSEVVEKLNNMGLMILTVSSAEFTKMVQDEIVQADRTMQVMGLEAQ